jgi:hypothetical protein
MEIDVPENSTLTYASNNIDLGCGSSSVFIRPGKAVLHTADGLTITPQQGEGFAKVEVQQGGGISYIHVILGSAVVSRGDQTSLVKAGYKLELTGNPCGGPVESAANRAGVPAAEGAKAGKWVPIAAVAGGGAVAGIILATRGKDNENTPVSPVRP